jgi:hypothetical protein
MMESLGLMEMVIELKMAFPNNFHFLKGNHENIANEEGFGNHPFRKFAFEGHMVARWVQTFYGKDFIDSYYEFEKNLPLFVIGRNFIISHAEPLYFFEREAIVEYRNNPDVVEGLTWTANDEADPESLIKPEGSINLDEDIFEIESVAASARQVDFNFQKGKEDA